MGEYTFNDAYQDLMLMGDGATGGEERAECYQRLFIFVSTLEEAAEELRKSFASIGDDR